MKIVQFPKDDIPALGIQTSSGIIDVAAEAIRLLPPVYRNTMELVCSGDEGLRVLDAIQRNSPSFLFSQHNCSYFKNG